MSKLNLSIIYLICYLTQIFVTGIDDVLIVTTENPEVKESGSKEGAVEEDREPEIYEMQIDSNVTNRFAHTIVASKVRNLNNVAREATFAVILPDKAFISEFVMVIDGKSYKAYVKEKAEAKNIYDQAIASGRGAAHVAVSARESNRFTVSVNIEAQSKATFLLTYEELLRRKENMYELVINIHPKQPVKDMYVNVMINESRPLKFVKTAAIRSGNEITKGEGDLDSRASTYIINSTAAFVKFSPSIERQKELAKYLGTDMNEGLSGQFVVQYDVERDSNGGEVLVNDGYFVHFFAPSDIKPLNKFIIFVLDTSGSMYGQKVQQLREAMSAILDQLDEKDYFHIISFQSAVNVFDIRNPENTVSTVYHWYRSDDYVIPDSDFPRAFAASPDNIKRAKKIVSQFEASGGTSIYRGLETALTLIRREKENRGNKHIPQPMIMFLTDGYPSDRTADAIVSAITKDNEPRVPIYSLSLGEDADKTFLKKLSQRNLGFSRHIYEASDAALQLRNFYREIASPLLSDVKFEYVPEATHLTKTKFPIHFGGSEIVVSGKIRDTPKTTEISKVHCFEIDGPAVLKPVVERPVTSLERLWAYLTIQQLLDDRETTENKTANEKKALELALQYSFVTPVSSLVVVKPNSNDSDVNLQAADKVERGIPSIPSFMPTYRAASALSRTQFTSQMWGGRSALMRMPESRKASVAVVPLSVFSTNHIQYSTPAATDNLSSLKSALPWLSGVLSVDGTLKLPNGGYLLGAYETFTYDTECGLTPTNTTGYCKLLHDCPQVHSMLTSVDIFVKYFCHIASRFAGVCCP